MRKQILFIVEVSIFSALGLVLDFLAGLYSGYIWPNGGSITIAFVPIFIMAYKYGIKGGLLTGLIIGTIQLLWSSHLINFFQIMLDYIIPNVVLGLVGIKSQKYLHTKTTVKNIYISISILIVSALRLISLVISGVVYWNTPFIASILYNGPFTLFSCIASIIVTIILLNTLFKNKFLN